MSDCLIVGGGIIGLLTARELSSSGANVVVIERNQIGQESSWAGGGIISPLYPWRYSPAVTALAGWSQKHYPALAQSLMEASGTDPEYVVSGLLIPEFHEQSQAVDWSAKYNITLKILSPEETKKCEVALSQLDQSAIWMPNVAQVRNPRFVRAARNALPPSVKILENASANELLIQNGRIQGVKSATETLLADNVIVCAGAWTRSLLAPLGSAPAIEPVRGQMLLLQATRGLIKRIVLKDSRYVIPRRDGRVLVGSTLEYTGFEKNTTDEARDELLEVAKAIVPALDKCPLEKHWAGLRPGSPEGIPYIGPYPGVEGLYFNSGHFRNGVVLAPASARLITDIVLSRKPIVPPAPYSLDAKRAG